MSVEDESWERITNEKNQLLKTCDVSRMLHRSEAAIHKMLKLGQVPDYARPKKLHASARGYLWSKPAIQKWINSMQEVK